MYLHKRASNLLLFAIWYLFIWVLIIFSKDIEFIKLTSSDVEEKRIVIFQIAIIILPFLLLIIHILRISRLPYGLSIQSLGVFHKRKTCLNLQYKKAFDLAIQAIRNDKKSWCEIKDFANGKISAYRYEDSLIGFSIVIFELTMITEYETEVFISCMPTSFLCIFDFGVNLILIEKIINYLEKHDNVIHGN